jgi:hypothetical protein
MAHDVAKPKTAADPVVSVMVGSATADISNDKIFRIKPANVQLGFQVQVADVTGDSDTKASYTHNEMTRGQFTVQGYALGNQAIHWEKLQSTDNGSDDPAGSNTADIRFNWASGRYIYGIALIESIQISYARASPFVGVTMTGRFTDTDLGSATYADSTTGTIPT